MIAVTLILMLLSAAVSTLSVPTRLPRWASAATASTLLAIAAVTGAYSSPAHGVALAATYVVTVLAAVAGGSAIVTAVFGVARRDRSSDAPTPPGPDGDTEVAAGPLHGGRTIGVLERTAVAASILAGWPEGIAVVLAVKGLARYPELRGDESSDADPRATAEVSSASEQFIIGTFASVLWAVAVCGVGLAVIN